MCNRWQAAIDRARLIIHAGHRGDPVDRQQWRQVGATASVTNQHQSSRKSTMKSVKNVCLARHDVAKVYV